MKPAITLLALLFVLSLASCQVRCQLKSQPSPIGDMQPKEIA